MREPNPLWRFTFYSEDESSLNITDAKTHS